MCSLDSGFPVTVLRPSKIHGAGALRPREWVFVKRALDRRPAVFLARRGAGVDHTTAAMNLAALIEAVAAYPGRRIFNSADPDAPSALEISRAIAHALGHTWVEVLLDDADGDALGAHPWDAPYPIVLDMTAAAEIGYVPVGDYATTVVDEVEWLVARSEPLAPAASACRRVWTTSSSTGTSTIRGRIGISRTANSTRARIRSRVRSRRSRRGSTVP